jgi:hypothetical protein
MPERIINLSVEVSQLASQGAEDIREVTFVTDMLSVNALIEAARAGESGRGFAVVAQEVGRVSEKVRAVAQRLNEQLGQRVTGLKKLGASLVADIRGTRLTDLALNMIDIIDRNLYERSCDVRWWATDSAVVACAAEPTTSNKNYCSERLSVILASYTVYLDIWVCDCQGNVLASGRPTLYPQAATTNVAKTDWFQRAMITSDGGEFAVADISENDSLSGRSVATYAAAIRAGGKNDGRPIGVLGIFFDWQSQSQAVVNGVRLSQDERPRTRCLLIDSNHRVIAASDGRGLLAEIFPLQNFGQTMGNYSDPSGAVVGFARTPGYETYKGLGWYGVITQAPAA